MLLDFERNKSHTAVQCLDVAPSKNYRTCYLVFKELVVLMNHKDWSLELIMILKMEGAWRYSLMSSRQRSFLFAIIPNVWVLTRLQIASPDDENIIEEVQCVHKGFASNLFKCLLWTCGWKVFVLVRELWTPWYINVNPGDGSTNTKSV